MKKNKLNNLITGWKQGTVKTSRLLHSLGYTDSLLANYVKNGWLERVAQGLFKLRNDEITIYSAINALQFQLDIPIRIGGKSSLQLKGFGHNIRLNEKEITLFVNSNSLLPTWFLNDIWEVKPVVVKTNRCVATETVLEIIEVEKVNVKISAPELAILEMLFQVPKKETLNETELIFEGLYLLRLKNLKEALNTCKSFKARRLFFYLVDKVKPQWSHKLDSKDYDLGKGKFQINQGGKFNSKHMIVV